MTNGLLTQPIKLESDKIKLLEDMALTVSLLKTEVAKAKRAGIDVSEIEEKLNTTARLREGLLKEYR